MPVQAKCGCGASYNVAESTAGKTLKCKKCGGLFTVPSKKKIADLSNLVRERVALVSSIKTRDVEKLKSLIAQGADIYFLPAGAKGGSLLHQALTLDDRILPDGRDVYMSDVLDDNIDLICVIDILLKHKLDPNLKNNEGLTPLEVAEEFLSYHAKKEIEGELYKDLVKDWIEPYVKVFKKNGAQIPKNIQYVDRYFIGKGCVIAIVCVVCVCCILALFDTGKRKKRKPSHKTYSQPDKNLKKINTLFEEVNESIRRGIWTEEDGEPTVALLHYERARRSLEELRGILNPSKPEWGRLQNMEKQVEDKIQKLK